MLIRLLKVFIYISLPLLLFAFIFVGIQLFELAKQQIMLSEDCKKCTVDSGILNISENGRGIIEFNVNGKNFRVKTLSSSSELKKNQGEKVEFIYLKKDPSFNRINIELENEAFKNTIYLEIFIALFGVFWIIILILIKRRERKARLTVRC